MSYFRRQKAVLETSSSGSEETLWLITLSDLMTNLMLFFLVMYAITRMPETDRMKFTKTLAKALKGEKVKPQTEVVKEEEQQKKEEEDVAAALKKLLQTDDTDVVVTEKLIRIRFSRPVWFRSGSAELQPQAAADLRPICEMLKGLPNAIIVAGHTDDVPIKSTRYKSNWELSSARAAAVRRFMVQDVGISESRMIMAAYGEYKPVADNKTPQGRRLNRRIEITVVRR
ncbi:MAG TPA: OmpA family protein [Elusimicrobiota bacterium]|nr:OmpA family protein [Elusimicrobiota bacterium]